ncbi:dihydrodipicolinate synthase family protein [Chloroflexota bacterium]
MWIGQKVNKIDKGGDSVAIKRSKTKKSGLKKWARENMKGVENELLPSFTVDLSELDEAGIRLDVQQSIKHGFFSMLCTCECGLTFEEAKRFVEIAADEAKDKIFVSTTLLFDSLDKNREMLKHAEEVGCDSVLFGYQPNYRPDTEEEIYQLTKEMLEKTNLAITLYPHPQYNFERFHPSGFPPKLLDRMADIDNVVAIKVGEPGLMAECVRLLGSRLLVSCPIERWLPLNYLTFGQQWIGAGPYEVMQSPEKPYMVEYFNLMMKGEMDKAMEIYWSLTLPRVMFEQQFMPSQMLGTYNWTQHKFYQWLVGGNGGFTRQPCMKLYQHDMEATRMAFRMVGITPSENDEEFYVGRANYTKLQKSTEAEVKADVSEAIFSDVDDNKVSLTNFKGKVTVLFGGGKEASEETKKWGQILSREHPSLQHVNLIEAAFVGKLPPFIPKQMVKKGLVESATAVLLIDWDGSPIKILGLDKSNVPNIFIIDKEGFLRFMLVGKYSEDGLSTVIEQVEQLAG